MQTIGAIIDQYGTLLALALVIGVSGWLGLLAEKAVQRGAFVKGYFLGNRGLGVWAMALTATVQSGGTFVGFPSYVYAHGWVVMLWIASYMVTPLMCFALMGKRLAQLSRRTGAVTLPDMFRGRFDHSGIGLIASLMVIFIMSMMMIAQFKAGAVVMKSALPGSSSMGEAVLDWTQLGSQADAGDDPLIQRMHDRANELDLVPGDFSSFAALGDRINTVEEQSGKTAYLIALCVFTVTVVGYTLFGGFLASVWTDLFQSVLMLIGVLLLVFLVLGAPEVGGLSGATEKAVANTGEKYALPPGYIAHRSAQPPTPMEAQNIAAGFLPFTLAICYFFMWPFAGTGSTATMVRVMASRDSASMRRSIFVLAIYNFLIYVPLVFICIGARAVFPDLAVSDETIPRITLWGTSRLAGGSLWAGLVMSAPFGAVMATVSTYLVVIASGLVHDVYQRFIRPDATEREVRRVTYASMVLVGLFAVIMNIEPVQFLQAIVVFSGVCGATTFLIPALMACYWRRATTAGAIASMLGGFICVLILFAVGLVINYDHANHRLVLKPWQPLMIEPIIWGLLASGVFGIGVSLLTKPPKPEVVARLFDGDRVTA